MRITTPICDEVARYLDLSAAELKLTAANMANVDTPGYRTLGMNFSAEMRRAIAEVHEERAGAAAPGGPRDAKPHVFEVDHLIERPDGNNVSMDREGLDMAEAQLRFRAGVELLQREFTRISDAIHAGSK